MKKNQDLKNVDDCIGLLGNRITNTQHTQRSWGEIDHNVNQLRLDRVCVLVTLYCDNKKHYFALPIFQVHGIKFNRIFKNSNSVS